MGEALVHAVSTVKERQSGPDQEVRSARNGNIPDSSSGHPLERDGGGGLWGVCRTLFQHCAGAIGYVEKSAGEEEGVQGVSDTMISERGLWFRRGASCFLSIIIMGVVARAVVRLFCLFIDKTMSAAAAK